jgi:hypothetical protein
LVLSLKTLATVIGAPGLTGTHVLEHAALEFVSAHENATIQRKRDNKINSIPISFMIFGYRPANGGKGCQGKSEDSELCNTNPCSEWMDFRGEQCATIPLLFPMNESLFSMTWLPWEVNNRKFKNVRQYIFFLLLLYFHFIMDRTS